MADKPTVRVSKNGPYTIQGDVELVGVDGEPWTDLPPGKPLALCRCGRSQAKPFCDGSHSKADFDSNPSPSDQPYPF